MKRIKVETFERMTMEDGIAIKSVEQESELDKIKGYIDHIRNTGMGKKKSLDFIKKFIEGLKSESEIRNG